MLTVSTLSLWLNLADGLNFYFIKKQATIFWFEASNKSLFQKLEQHSAVIKDGNLLGPTDAFWFSFIEMLEILFTFTRTLRVGNWECRLCATRKMLPWFFVYEKPTTHALEQSNYQLHWISRELTQASMQSLCKPFDLFFKVTS